MKRRNFVWLLAAAPALRAERRPLATTPIQLPDGKKLVPRTEYAGKVVLIVMISTACESCARTVQWLGRIQTELGPRGLQVVGIAFDEQAKEKIVDFTMRYRPSFPVGYMDLKTGLKYADIPDGKRPTVPILMFVDKKGVVRFEYQRDEPFFNDAERQTRLIASGLINEGRPGIPPTQRKTVSK